jgi:hypothetical protein
MDSFDTSAKESLKTNLRAKLNCNPPACLLEITLSSASVKVGVKVTIPRCRTAPSRRPLGCSRWSTLVYLRNTHVASMSLTMRHIPPCACSSGTGAATNAASITSNVQSVANAIADSPASVSADLGVMVVSASAPVVEQNQQISMLVPTQAGGGSSGLIIGAIGGVVGSIAVLGIIIFVYRRRKKSGSFSKRFPEHQPAQASRASKSSSSTQPTLIEANEILKRELGLEGSISSVVEQAAAQLGVEPGPPLPVLAQQCLRELRRPEAAVMEQGGSSFGAEHQPAQASTSSFGGGRAYAIEEAKSQQSVTAPGQVGLDLGSPNTGQRQAPTGAKFDPNTGRPIPKFNPQTGVQNW